MSEIKHTPGPWHVSTDCHREINGDRWGQVEAVRHPAGGAGSPPSGMSQIAWSGPTGEANARLIAAAPDLLAAAMDLDAAHAAMLRLLESGGHTGEEFDAHAERQNAAMNALRLAIAKARGGAA